MDERRQGDVRVYVVSALFFLCIFSGGVFLILYMLLPETQSSAWYPIAGMVLVSIPWAFWLFTFLYRCIRSHHSVPTTNSARFHKAAGGGSAREPALAVADLPDENSPGSESPEPGERRVQFGPVVVLGSEGNHDLSPTELLQQQQHIRESSEVSNCSGESEIPLRSSA